MLTKKRRKFLKTPEIIAILILSVGFLQPLQAQPVAAADPSLDASLLHGIYQWEGTVAEGIMPLATISAYPAFALIPLGIAVEEIHRGDIATTVELGSAMAFTYGLTRSLKALIKRARPYHRFQDIQLRSVQPQLSEETTLDAFPSGHVAMAAGIATSLSLQYDSAVARSLTGGWVALVAVSRVWMGEHHPSDVLGGAVVGSASALTAHLLSRRVHFTFQYDRHGSGIAMNLIF